jgi:flagellar export protein FliJ
MKPFKFPLESLRVIRKQKEHAAQQRYARSLAACKRVESQLEDALTELAACWDEIKRELASNAAAGKLAQLRTWSTVLEIRWHERKAALAEARRFADLAFQEMISATREREGLDRFHDKALLAHDLESQREEQKNFDEMAVQSNGARGLLQFAGAKSAY